MPDRSSFTDESVLMRWMKLEIGRINEGMVVERKTLSTLLTEEIPSARTRSGNPYYFDNVILQILGGRLPKEIKDTLRLPISLFFDIDVRDSYFLTDPVAAEALKSLGELSTLRELRNGRLWVAKPIIHTLMKKYPTILQIVIG